MCSSESDQERGVKDVSVMSRWLQRAILSWRDPLRGKGEGGGGGVFVEVRVLFRFGVVRAVMK